MTGFASTEGELYGRRVRCEIRSLNHRFLDIKLRIPKDLQSIETSARKFIRERISRGSLEVRITLTTDPEDQYRDLKPNIALAAHYLECFNAIRKTVGLEDPIQTRDLLSLPDIITRDWIPPRDQRSDEELWKEVKPLLGVGLTRLMESRETEGQTVVEAMQKLTRELRSRIHRLKELREQSKHTMDSRVRTRMKQLFERYPLDIENAAAKDVLETRMAQELAILLDRTDIEEELTRFEGHIDHFEKVLSSERVIGKKLEFLLQELHREINTLGNKAQDLTLSEEVVPTKALIEQLREQVLNLE